MIIYYDNKFNQNELFVLILLITTYIIVFSLPKRFPRLISAIFILYAIAWGHFCDHTVSIKPFDFYDVNDSSAYQIFDFLSYLMYGPFGYFIVYFFDRLKLKKQHAIPYTLLWSLIALGLEYTALKMGVYHYQKGWKMQYSIPAYLLIISVLLIMYYKLCRPKEAS